MSEYSMKLDKILGYYPDESFLVADGLDDAIIGVDSKSPRLVYSVSKAIDILAKDMPREEAIDHFYFNVEGSYVGEGTPIWVEDGFLTE